MVLSAAAAVTAIPPLHSAETLISQRSKEEQGNKRTKSSKSNNGVRGQWSKEEQGNNGIKSSNGNKGVRDHGRGEGRNGAGQGKGHGQKNKYR